MKKIFFILSLFICFLSKAQSNGDPAGFPTVNSAPYYKMNGFIQTADGKAIIFPTTDTAWHPRFAGTTVYKSSDSSIYWWTGHIWTKAAGGGGGGGGTQSWDSTMNVSPDFLASHTSNFHGFNWEIDSIGNLALYSGDINFSGVASQIIMNQNAAQIFSQTNATTTANITTTITPIPNSSMLATDGANTASIVTSSDGKTIFDGNDFVGYHTTAAGIGGDTYEKFPIPTTAGNYYIPLSVNNILADATGNINIGSQISSSTTQYQFQDSTNTPPVSFPVGFDSVYYMIGGAGNGIFTGHNYEIALYVNGVFATFIVPTINDWGFVLTGAAANTWHQYDGSTWPRRNAPAWVTSGNLGGGILGSTTPSNVFFQYNGANRIILQGNAQIRTPTLTGVAAGLMGLSTLGVWSNIQLGTNLSFSGSTLNATGGTTLNGTGYVLMAGTTPSYNAVIPIVGGGTNNGSLSVTNGNLFYADGTKFVSLGIGTTRQKLGVVGGIPAWVDSTAVGSTITASNGVNKNVNDIQLGGALTANTTISGAFTLTLSPSRLITNQADSFASVATNSWSASSSGTLGLYAVGTLTERANAVSSSSLTTAFYGSLTSGDSTGLFTQLAGGRIGNFLLGVTSATATNVLYYDATTKKITYSPPSAAALVVGTTAITSGTNTRILYDNSGVLGEYTVTGTGTTAVLSTTPTFTTSIIDPLVIGSASANGTLTLQGNNAGASNTGTNANLLFKVGNTPTTALTINNNLQASFTPGTLTDLVPGLLYTATMPTTMTGTNTAINFQITGAGSSSFTSRGMAVVFNAGYTGSSATVAAVFQNVNAGTGTGLYLGTDNRAFSASATGITATGYNNAIYGAASGGKKNIGAVGQAGGNSATITNVGVIGFGTNITGGGVEIGGYFGLDGSDPALANSAALIADIAGRTSEPYQLWASSGTIAAQLIPTSGSTPSARMFIGATTTPTATLHLAAGTTNASTAPLKFITGVVMATAEAGAFEYVTPTLSFTNDGLQRQEIPLIQQSRVTTQFDKTDQTLANITGLTATVVAGKKYRFEATLYTTSDVAGGIKVAIAGTATATAIIYEGLTTDAGLTTQSRTTTIGNAVGAVTAVTNAYVKITGTITVNGAGTLTVQSARNAATGTTSILVGSIFVLTEMP